VKDPIEEFLDAIEKMIDAQDDMWHEEYYSNYRHRRQIYNEEYLPAREKARSSFREALQEALKKASEKSS